MGNPSSSCSFPIADGASGALRVGRAEAAAARRLEQNDVVRFQSELARLAHRLPIDEEVPGSAGRAAREPVWPLVEPARHSIEEPGIGGAHAELDHLPVTAAHMACASGASPELL